jgi:cytoskeletal protein RodZ
MRRFRLSTLMLLIVIAALTSALWIQERRGLVRDRELTQFQLGKQVSEAQYKAQDAQRILEEDRLRLRWEIQAAGREKWELEAATRESAPRAPASEACVPAADEAP